MVKTDPLIEKIVTGARDGAFRHDVRRMAARQQFEAVDGTPYFVGPNKEIRRMDYKPTLKERKALNAERRRQRARATRASG